VGWQWLGCLTRNQWMPEFEPHRRLHFWSLARNFYSHC